MLARLPERVRTPAVARAVLSPSAILLAGAGAAVAIAGGAPLAAAALAGGLAWAVRVALAVPRGGPQADRIDPFRVGEPWRRYVQDAQQARARFARAVRSTRAGPLRERLEIVGRRIDDGVRECWRVACEGDALEDAFDQLDVKAIRGELADVEVERHRSGDRSKASFDRAEQALHAQLASAERIASVAQDAQDRLRALTAQLDEAVARAVELSVSASEAGVTPLSDDVEGIVGELEALRAGMEEAGGAGNGGAPASSPT